VLLRVADGDRLSSLPDNTKNSGRRMGFRLRVRALWWVCGLWLLPLAVWAQPALVGAPGSGGQDLTPHWTHLPDPGANLTFDQVQAAQAAGQFAPVPGGKNAVAFGFTDSAYWLRVVLRNPFDTPVAPLLEISNARISQVDLYAPDAGGQYRAHHTGGDLPFASRALPNRQLVFPLVLAPQAEQVLYLRVQSTIGLIVPATLWPKADFALYARDDYAAQAWYFGMAAAMALFNLMLFVALRDRIYLMYVAFVGSVALTIASKSGLAAEFLWPQQLIWSNVSYYAFTSLSLATFLMFTRRMLSTREALPRVDRLMRFFIGLHLLAPLAYMAALSQLARYSIYVFLVTALTVVVVTVWCLWRRKRAAYFYASAFALIVAGSVITLMRTMGVLPTNVFTINALQFGSSLEMLLLAFALADRFNLLRREKLQAQQQLLATQDQLVHSLQASERTLALRVEERTQQLQTLNEKLEALSMVDGLTGIANRRQFDQVLQQEWQRMERTQQPLALVMIDVDWFKRYNDHYGHPAGDQCLRQVATAIAALGRSSDLMARYGGEEFVLVAPATDADQALALAQRACATVQALALPHTGSEIGVVTLSCGVAAIVPQPGQDSAQLMRAADAALYRAKHQGRNQAVAARPEDC
jgi:two-component system, sensor histidine kinase LadS